MTLNRLLLKLETFKLPLLFANLNIKSLSKITKKKVIINIPYIEHYFIDVYENTLCNINFAEHGPKANESAIKGK